MEKIIISNSPKQTQDIGEKFTKNLEGKRIIALYGDLGSGKTTFAQGFAKGLGIKQRIISPTFILIRTYNNFHHIDLYRIETKDLKELGIEEILNDLESIVIVEWAEKIKHLLPKERWDVEFEYEGQDKRKITFKNGQ